MSNVAKAVATFEFLRGAEYYRENIEKMAKGGRFAKNLPPISSKPGAKSVLDAGIMRQYFKEYNNGKTLKDANGKVIQRNVSISRSMKKNPGIQKASDVETHERIIKRLCK